MFKDALATLGIGVSLWGTVPALEPGWRDLRVGNGAPVVVGDRVTVHFLVISQTKDELANSRKRGLPYSFVVSPEPTDLLSRIALGMRAGGSRLAPIPPDRAYGANGLVPIVPQNASLEITLNLISVAGR